MPSMMRELILGFHGQRTKVKVIKDRYGNSHVNLIDINLTIKCILIKLCICVAYDKGQSSKSNVGVHGNATLHIALVSILAHVAFTQFDSFCKFAENAV